MEITSNSLKAIKAIFRTLGMDKEQQEYMIAAFTESRTTSCKGLTQEEANRLIRHLKTLDPQEKSAEKMRRKIISLAHEMGWHKSGTKDADMARIDGWCKKFSSLKKSLDRHTYKELPALVSQFQFGPYKDFFTSKKS